MKGSEREILGCLVRDAQSGVSIGWVRAVVFDADGERVTELLVDPGGKRRPGAAGESGERLVGQALYDPAGRWIGEIVDAVAGTDSGRLQGLLVDRGDAGDGTPDFVPAYQGLIYEGDHWALLEEVPRLRSSLLPSEPPVRMPDPAEDWMVGHTAAGRLVDKHGRTIIDKGQPVTPAVVEHASRAGLLHLLDVE